VTSPLILLDFHKVYCIPGIQPGTETFAIASIATLLIEYERHEFWGEGSLQIDCARKPEKWKMINGVHLLSPHCIIAMGKHFIFFFILLAIPYSYHQLLVGAFVDGQVTAAGIKRFDTLLREDCKNMTLLSTVLLA
jgi:hypothetical protein